ncbi:late secretory pathway protein avl9 [Actinomortierella wolfii]|nr:late secretory pathway protein avl9 [Actinomortierella wolfii]
MGVILHIIVVGFHHAHGPIVEYAYPPFPGQEPRTQLQRLEVPDEWSLLPFLALPDGSHQSDEDFTYFHLPPPADRKDVATTLFGISCNRQILTKDLLVKSDEFTRSSVQKAVIVLATQPIFGVLRQRLGVVTAAWFGQRDFSQTDILMQFYDSLQATVSDNIPDSAFLMGTSLRELVKKFKYKVLVLLKLLLLEKRVLFFGYPVETLCTYQYSLISLIPGLLKALQDTGSPVLDSEDQYIQTMAKTPRHSTDKQQLFKYLGLPLHIFGRGAFFQPYLPLQQIDILQDRRTESYMIGTTNAIFLHNRDISADVIVNTEPGIIEYLNDSLSSILTLTAADRRWMDEIIEAVSNSSSGAAQTEFVGSDDYLRAKFEEYILTLLSSVKHAQFTKNEDPVEGIGHPNDRHLTADYGMYFIRAWQQTNNYRLWNDFVDWELLNEIVVPGHPCQGNFSLSDVQRRLAIQFKDMKLDKNLAPLKQSFSRAVTTSRERLTNVLDSMWQEFEKLQTDEGGGNGSQNDPLMTYSNDSTKSPYSPTRLVHSKSTHPAPSPNARAAPDSELSNSDELDDAVVPPPSKSTGNPASRSSPFGRNFGTRPKASNTTDVGNNNTLDSGTSSRTGSPNSAVGGGSSSLSATLGPATAATAALGQKAAGMFSNVSNFFQTKKKEFLDAQREAEEQYQQRIYEHERKKRVMQERARATASTFTLPSTISRAEGLKLARSSVGGTPSKVESAPGSPVTKSLGQARVGTGSNVVSSSPSTPSDGSKVNAPTSTTTAGADGAFSPLEASDRPRSSTSQSPTLTRANGAMATEEEQLKELEQDLREAIGSEPSPLKRQQQRQASTQDRLSAGQEASLTLTPLRSTTPTNDGASSPFMVLSVPVSPADPEAKISSQLGESQQQKEQTIGDQGSSPESSSSVTNPLEAPLAP